MSVPVWMAGAALVAVAMLAAAVWLRFGRARAAPIAEAEACAAAQAAIPGFAARQALIGDDRCAALVVGADTRVVLVTARRPVPTAREIRWRDIRAVAGGLRIDADGRDRAVLVAGVDVLDVRRAGDDDWRRR